ncbi:hypothetical protein AAVH_15490 [Aphelenchoides avenae]|nr:hypothetical protein AAVH_15490 [Aphelenchus avenae]
MKTEPQSGAKIEPERDTDSVHTVFDKRRQLAPRTSEDEAVFIAQKYLEHRGILEAKLANTVNGGRFLRQNLLEVVAAEVSSKFGVANRSRKYVEQKLRDMKKEARKYFLLQQVMKPRFHAG